MRRDALCARLAALRMKTGVVSEDSAPDETDNVIQQLQTRLNDVLTQIAVYEDSGARWSAGV
jgi:hypothetical protein